MTKRSNPALWLLSLGNGGVDRPFNEAVGGTVTEIDDYNGTGERWRVHTFTGSGTLDVSTAVQPFRVLLFAGGGSRGSGNQGGGGAGGHIQDDAFAIAAGSHSIAVGKAGTVPSSGQGRKGGDTTAFGLTAIGGGGGGYFTGGGGRAGSAGGCGGGGGGGGRKPGAGSAGGGGAGSQGGNGGAGVTDQGTAENSSIGPGGGGGGAGGNASSTTAGPGKAFDITGATVTRGAGGSAGATAGQGWNGNDGAVIVAYQIG